jgi:hypothetical protein
MHIELMEVQTDRYSHIHEDGGSRLWLTRWKMNNTVNHMELPSYAGSHTVVYSGPFNTASPTASEHEYDEEEDSTYCEDENSTIKTIAWADAATGPAPMSLCSRRTGPRSLSGAQASTSLVVEIPSQNFGKISCAKTASPKKRRKINFKLRRDQVSLNRGTAVL